MAYPPQAEEDVCAHKPCDCKVKEGQKYCCDVCREADLTEDSEPCPCDCCD